MEAVWVILGLLGLVLLGLAMPFVAALCESRLLWPYGPPRPSHDVRDPQGYGQTNVQEAIAGGFVFLGWLDDMKGRAYKLSYAMLVSPDRETIAVVGIGTLIGIPLACTWLYTFGASKQRNCTSLDDERGVETDVLGLAITRLSVGGTFMERWQAHRRWYQEQIMDRVILFAAGRELKDYEALRRERYDLMARAGLIRLVGDGGPRWKYTFAGALKVSLGTMWTQLTRRKTARVKS